MTAALLAVVAAFLLWSARAVHREGHLYTQDNCTNVTAVNNTNCTTPPLSQNVTIGCALRWVWNESYNPMVDEEYRLGWYVCGGCDRGFVVSNGTVITQLEVCGYERENFVCRRNPILPPRVSSLGTMQSVGIVANTNNTTSNVSSGNSSSLDSAPSSSGESGDNSNNNNTVLNGTYECAPCSVVEDTARLKYTVGNGSNATTRRRSPYYFYQKKQNNTNFTLPYTCAVCDQVDLVTRPYVLMGITNISRVQRQVNETSVTDEAIYLWKKHAYLTPQQHALQYTHTMIVNCTGTSTNGTSSLRGSGDNSTQGGCRNMSVSEPAEQQNYTAYDFMWECQSRNITSDSVHVDSWFHYLRACPDCIAVQSVCESPLNFLYGMCMCDPTCGEEHLYKTGRCVQVTQEYIGNDITKKRYYNTTRRKGRWSQERRVETDAIKMICQTCPPFYAVTGDFIFTSNCTTNTLVVQLFWAIVLVTGFYILKKSTKHIIKLYRGRGVWQGYYAPINYEEGRFLMNRLTNFYKLVFLHDEGYFVLMAMGRSFLLMVFVAFPKVILGEGSEIGIMPLVTVFYAVVAVLDVWLIPELTLFMLTHIIRTGLPRNYYKLHLIKYLHDSLDVSYRIPRLILATFSFMGPIMLVIFTASTYKARLTIIPFTFQRDLVSLYEIYIRVHSFVTICLFLVVSTYGMGKFHFKFVSFKKLVIEDCYKERGKVGTSRRIQMIELAHTFEQTLCAYIAMVVVAMGFWYFGLVFSATLRVHIAYGLPWMSIGVDVAILVLLDRACYGYPRRVNSSVSRRYIRVGDNLKGFEDNAELTKTGNIFAELKQQKGDDETVVQAEPAKLHPCCYLPCCVMCRPKERVNPLSNMQDMNEQASSRAHEAFQQMGLDDNDVDKFHSLYLKMDKDNGGSIDIQEFYRYFRLQRSPFSDRVFQVMDGDGSKELDFVEFVVSLWNFCSLNLGGLILFAFTLYDADDSGELEMDELMVMLKEIYGSSAEISSRVTTLVKKIDASGDGSVQIHEFIRACKRHGQILAPAHSVQEYLQQKSFGTGYWKELVKKRQLSKLSSQEALKAFLKEMDLLRKNEKGIPFSSS
jgi:serine/threonine-protein phosphatase 2B regulatory subunit